MAALQARLTLASTALTAATAKTVMQLTAPTNQRLKIQAISIFFDGTSTTGQPVQYRVLRQTTAGTMTTQPPVLIEPELTETIQATGQVNATVEPTAGAVLEVGAVHPQTGLTIFYPFGQEIIVGGGGRVGIELNAPAGVNARGFIHYEE